MGRLSRVAKGASKKTVIAVGRGTGRLVKRTVRSGYDGRRVARSDGLVSRRWSS